MADKPKPGSAEAVDLGCTCPIIDNHYGKGIPLNGKRFHYMNDDCPLHGTSQPLPHSEDEA
jgi:hypothetical protein